MSFAIMRFAKLKTGAPMSGSISHVTRSRETPNADPLRRDLNRAIIGHNDPAAIHAAIEQRTPAKFRRDAVRALEFVITATPDWFHENQGQTDQYFDSAVEWLHSEFGAENVVSAVQHNDESTPHMHAYVVPVDPETGRLNAKLWVGGKGKMQKLQSTFADHQAKFGVERGKPRPERKHTTVQEWYNGHADLDSREAALEAREQAVRAEAEKAANDRQAAAQALSEADLKTREAEQLKARLGLLQDDLVNEREKLQRAGQKLLKWQAERDAWIAEHRPVELSRVERLSLEFAEMSPKQRLAEMQQLWKDDNAIARAVDRLNWVTYEDGSVTPEGRRILAERGGIEQHDQRIEDWKQSGLEPGSKGAGL